MSAIARFLAKVDLTAGPSDCQEWTGARTEYGYGVLGLGTRSEGTVNAHRYILGVLRGRPLERHERALHRCDNPPCINPLHLYVGSASDNILDAVARGRWPQRRGRILGPEVCGTARGFARHRRRKEPLCQRCRDARGLT